MAGKEHSIERGRVHYKWDNSLTPAVEIDSGDIVHFDQHGVVTIPPEIAGGIPEAIAKVEADEKKIISTCQAPGFTPDKLKELYKQIRPGTY